MNPYQIREVFAAAPDAITGMLDEPVLDRHPLAVTLTLKDIAAVCAQRHSPRKSYENEVALWGRGMGTQEFSQLLADGAATPTYAAYGAQAEDFLRFCTRVDVDNFHPVHVPTIEADPDMEPLREHAEVTYFNAIINAGSAPVQLTTYARRLAISRHAVINGQIADFGRLVIGLGASAARIEARLIAGALEANGNLDDGQPVFHADHQNIVAADFDGVQLGNAMALLRTQPTASGQRADLKANHLIVAPDLERQARAVVHAEGLSLTVSVLANLPTKRWFLMADPKIQPVVGTLRLLGSKLPIRVESARRPDYSDSTFISVRADLGATMLRRVGIVRGGA